MRRTLTVLSFAAIAALALPLQAQHVHAPAGAPQSEADKAYAAAHETMVRAMNVPPSGDPDRDFAAMMIPHHQGAIDMARVLLRYGKDPEMRRLAETITADQEREIAQMTAWLQRNPPPQQTR